MREAVGTEMRDKGVYKDAQGWYSDQKPDLLRVAHIQSRVPMHFSSLDMFEVVKFSLAV